ncbi:DUF89 domain-containing protein [Thermodesulfobacteriota bacterium]
MKTYLDCIPCFFQQALLSSKAADIEDDVTKRILDRLALLVPEIPLDSTPPETGRMVYKILREVSGVDNPFKAWKDASMQKAFELYPSLKEKVQGSPDPLKTAVHIAIAGNIIDFATNPDFELKREVESILQRKPAINHYQSFKDHLEHANTVLYLADNAGETVFDKILIETMGKSVIYAVRDVPVINDATIEDAVTSGLDSVATVISSGSDAPGTLLNRCSEEFLGYYKEADIVISKGQGNFEALSQEQGPIFFFLMAKCPLIAKDIGVEQGDIIIKSQMES